MVLTHKHRQQNNKDAYFFSGHSSGSIKHHQCCFLPVLKQMYCKQHLYCPTFNCIWEKSSAASAPLGSDSFSVSWMVCSSQHTGLSSCCLSDDCLLFTIWAAWSSELRNTKETERWCLVIVWPLYRTTGRSERWPTETLEAIFCFLHAAFEDPWNDFFIRTVQLLQQAAHLNLEAVHVVWWRTDRDRQVHITGGFTLLSTDSLTWRGVHGKSVSVWGLMVLSLGGGF